MMVAGLLLLASCEYEPRIHMDVPGMHPLKIQLLGFDGCPGATVLEERLLEVVSHEHLDAIVEYVDLQSLPPDDSRRGWGSPTILVNGVDLYGESRPADQALSCRLYEAGWPSCDELEDRLHGQLVASRR